VNWLQNVGDTDILRDATSASAVFWYRARKSPLRVWGRAPHAPVALPGGPACFGPVQPRFILLRREWLAVIVSMVTIGWAAYLGWLAFQFLPSRNDRVVLRLRSFVRGGIEPLREPLQALNDADLRAKTADFKRRLAEGEALDDLRPEAYALVREPRAAACCPTTSSTSRAATRRPTPAKSNCAVRPRSSRTSAVSATPSMWPTRSGRPCRPSLAAVTQLRRAMPTRQFECQLIGAKVLEDCNVAEMRTGEGKTIVCYAALYLKVLQGLRVHMVTVNDYLVRRDAWFCQQVLGRLGVRGRLHHRRHGDLRPGGGRAPRRLLLRHHLRHQQRVRLRLPARQT